MKGMMAFHFRMEDDWLHGVLVHFLDILEEVVDGWNLEDEEY